MTMDYSSYANSDIIKIIDEEHLPAFRITRDKVLSILNNDKRLQENIHSIRHRIKDLRHLDEKITRKNEECKAMNKEPITAENVVQRVTDVVGVRVLHLHMSQFTAIHQALKKYIDSSDIFLFEDPKAYSWDPEYVAYFQELGVQAELKESLYTSVHYVFKTRPDNDYCCELQVRTLFEEAWGEIDHTVNYPKPTENLAIKEQLKVLARLVGAGTRLSDSIFKINNDDK